MPQASVRELRQYEYVGDTTITFTCESDAMAMDQLVDHFRHLIHPPLTRDSFERIGGKTFTCNGVPVEIPAH